MVALQDIKLVGKYLRKAVENPNDITAREKMSFANTLGGYSMTLENWYTSKHSMEHAMSAYHQTLTHKFIYVILNKKIQKRNSLIYLVKPNYFFFRKINYQNQ